MFVLMHACLLLFASLLRASVRPGILSCWLGCFTVGTSSSVFHEQTTTISLSKFADSWGPSWSAGVNFAYVLGIFFPSCTDIFTGINRADTLANPGKSIPIGTLGALGTTTLASLSFVIFFPMAFDRQFLLDDKDIVTKQAWPLPQFMNAAIIFAGVGAGMQCLAGAARLLACLAGDFAEVMPFLKRFHEEEPVRCLLLTVFLDLLLVLIGKLDSVAPFITMFMLLAYGFTNVACFALAFLKRASWRPSWKYFSMYSALAGSVMCAFVMLFTDWYFALAAISFCMAVYLFISYKKVKLDWGDIRDGMRLQRAIDSVLEVGCKPLHTNNWRPQFLHLFPVTDVTNSIDDKMLSFLGCIGKSKSYTMLVGMAQASCPVFAAMNDPSWEAAVFDLEGLADTEETEGEARRRKKPRHHRPNSQIVLALENVSQILYHQTQRYKHTRTTVRVIRYAESITSEMLGYIIQAAGFAHISPNVLLLAWPEDWNTAGEDHFFLQSLRAADNSCKAAMVLKGLRHFPDHDEPQTGTIDVWWERSDGGLMLLLATLLKRHKCWKDCRIRLLTFAFQDEDSDLLRMKCETFVSRMRIPASVHVVRFHTQPVSSYVVEKTLEVEERHQLLEDLQYARTQSDGKMAEYLQTISGDLSEIARHFRPQRQKTVKHMLEQRPSLSNIFGGGTGLPMDEKEKEKADGDKSSRAGAALRPSIADMFPSLAIPRNSAASSSATSSSSSSSSAIDGASSSSSSIPAVRVSAAAKVTPMSSPPLSGDSVPAAAASAAAPSSSSSSSSVPASSSSTSAPAPVSANASSELASVPQRQSSCAARPPLAPTTSSSSSSSSSSAASKAPAAAAATRSSVSITMPAAHSNRPSLSSVFPAGPSSATAAAAATAASKTISTTTTTTATTTTAAAAAKTTTTVSAAHGTYPAPMPSPPADNISSSSSSSLPPASLCLPPSASFTSVSSAASVSLSDASNLTDAEVKEGALAMATAVAYNLSIKNHSASENTSLVLMNLPSLSVYKSGQHFLSFVDALTEGLPRLLLVKGTRTEVVSQFF